MALTRARQRAVARHALRGLLIATVGLFTLFLLLDQLMPVDLVPGGGARVVVDSRGELMRAFADANGEWRYPTTLDQLSPLYLQALIHYEDRWFDYHFGINPLALLRAAWQWLVNGRIISGGSTLTMQVARIRYPNQEGDHGGIGAKLHQILRALQLEWHYSKEEILEYYVNHAPFGGTLQGVEAASRSYFGYPARQLTQAQAALLAVLPQAPSRYRPDRHPERARAQRDKVLDRLVTFGVLSPEAAADARLEAVEAQPPRRKTLAPLLARRLIRDHPDTTLIPTFIDRDLQERLEAMARDRTEVLPANSSLAIMVMEHATGKVVAYLGSADLHDAERFGHVDMVSALRSPGSTLKPFIYGLALDEGLIHSESLLMDVPLSFGDYRPQNFEHGFSGPVSVSHALQKSLNLPAVQLLERLEPGAFYAQMQTAGAGLRLPALATPSLAIALGGVATTLEDLVTLFSALGNNGESLTPRLTVDAPLQRRPLMSPGAAWIVRDILSRNRTGVGGSRGIAIKTGTSYGYRDTWALGVTEHHTLGVWVGSPDNAAMVGHFGNFTAVPILTAAAALLPSTDHTPHPRPESVSRDEICWPTGQAEAPSRCDQRHSAWLLDTLAPATLMGTAERTPLLPTPRLQLRRATDSGLRAALGCKLESREETIVLWPAPLQNWIPAPWRNNHRIPPLDPRCDRGDGLLSESPVQIVGLDEGARIKRHPSTTLQPRLEIHVVGGQPQWYWFLNGTLLEAEGARLNLALPQPGRYQLAVTDQAGMNDTIHFIVEP